MFDKLLDIVADTIASASPKSENGMHAISSEIKETPRVFRAETPKAEIKPSNTKDGFKNYIKESLDARAKQDALFAKMYAKPNKNLDECIQYIVGEMYKRCVKTGSYGFAVNDCADNSDLVGMAVHYYCEDDIKINSIGGSVKVQQVEPKKEYKPVMEVQVNRGAKKINDADYDNKEDLFAHLFDPE